MRRGCSRAKSNWSTSRPMHWGGKRVAQRGWMAMAAPSRLGLGGVISAQREGHLIRALAEQS
jgi:hypothetical protein